MDYKNSNTNNNDLGFDECSLRGICSISPTASAIKAAIFASIKEFAFYIVKMKALGAQNPQARHCFIEAFCTLIPNFDYSQENVKFIMACLQKHVSETKYAYLDLCKEKNESASFFKSLIKLSKNFEYNDVIKQGQKYAEKFNENLTEEQKKCLELILTILKSICLYIVELQGVNVDIEKYYQELLLAVDNSNYNELNEEQIKEFLKKYARINNEISREVFEARKANFGEFIKTEVLLSQRKGKAVLVAGANIKDLQMLLEATKDKGIDIYTHGQMITGHTFSKLKSYPHLIGNFGKGSEYFISDFSRFPGPIFLTRNSLLRVETLCNTRFFTTDTISNPNATKIIDYNFEPLIQSALRYDGFEDTEPEEKETIGIIEEDYFNKLSEISEQIKKGEIKHILTIGVSNRTTLQIEYFKKLFSLLPKNCFVISFYYNDADFKNILFNKIDYAYPFLFKTLDVLFELKQNYQLSINLLNTRCEPHTLPSMIHVKNEGADRIFIYPCSPNLINPSLVNMLVEIYNLDNYTTPENDIRAILGNN